MISAQPDEALMKQIAAGNAGAFRQLARRHLARAHAIAFRILHNREDAEEVAQESLSKVWQKAASFEPARSAYSTWFYRIVVNATLDRLRQRRPTAEPLDERIETVADGGDNGETAWMKAAESRHIRQVVSDLPEAQKIAVTLVYYEDFTQTEAARIMKLNLTALEGLLFRARKSLKARLCL
jgi:RNA polymerase sigma-70 factor (ECF subfamily)